MRELTPEEGRKMLEGVISPKSDVEKIKDCSDERLNELQDIVNNEIRRRETKKWNEESEQRRKDEIERKKKMPFIISKRSDGLWEMEAVGHMGNGNSAGYGPYDTKEKCLDMISDTMKEADYPIIIKE